MGQHLAYYGCESKGIGLPVVQTPRRRVFQPEKRADEASARLLSLEPAILDTLRALNTQLVLEFVEGGAADFEFGVAHGV